MLVQTCLRQTNRSTRTAGDAMRPPGPQVCNDMFVDAALSVLISARTRHLVICDEDGRCTGLVTRTQLTAHRSTPWYTDVTRLRVTSFHDRGPFTLSATLLHDAERTMRDRALCDSPVVDDEGYVLGVLAFSH